MKLLHTSDWHLGRSLHGVGLMEAQADYADHLLETVRSERVDLVVVSGDIYDRALPPVEAISLADETLHRLAAAGVRTVVTSGNHDSAIRLGAQSRLADAAGVHLRTRWQDVGTPVVVDDRYGSVAVYGLPYLEPDAVRHAWGLSRRSHEATLREATDRIRADLGRRGGRSVVMAHAFVAGSPEAAASARSDSERDISVGGVEIVPTSLFTDFTYTALGHLHGPRQLTETVRYSGSPLAYSFSEGRHTKGSWLVELGPDGFVGADFVTAPVVRQMSSLRGRLEDLLQNPVLAELEDHWLAVTLSDADTPVNAMRRLRDRFPHTLTLAFEPEMGSKARAELGHPRTRGRSDLDIALGFLDDVRAAEATSEEELLLGLACDSCRINADADSDARIRVPVLQSTSRGSTSSTSRAAAQPTAGLAPSRAG